MDSKKEYITPQTEEIVFETDDIVTVSNPDEDETGHGK